MTGKSWVGRGGGSRGWRENWPRRRWPGQPTLFAVRYEACRAPPLSPPRQTPRAAREILEAVKALTLPPPLLSNCREAIAGEVRSAMESAGVIGARLAAAHTTNASICAEAAEGQRKLAEFAALFAARGLDAPDSSAAVGSEGGGGVGSGRAGGNGDDRQELEQRLRDIAGEAAAASAAAEEMQHTHAAANATITAEAVDALGR